MLKPGFHAVGAVRSTSTSAGARNAGVGWGWGDICDGKAMGWGSAEATGEARARFSGSQQDMKAGVSGRPGQA